MVLKVEVKKGDSPISFLKEEDKKRYYCCLINGRVRELNYKFDFDGEVKIQYLDLTSQEGAKIYSTSIRYLIGWAVNKVNPRLDVRIFYNVSRSLFCKIVYPKNFKVTSTFVDAVRRRMDELVLKDIPFNRIRISKEEALVRYKEEKLTDKINVLKYRSENFVHLYEAKDGDETYFDYLYGPMVPSTGYLKDYIVRIYNPGFLVQIPRSECLGTIPPFNDELNFANTLASTSHWAEDNHLDTVVDINKFIKKYDAMTLINLCESRINNMLADLGNEIIDLRDEPARVICIAGPSSSGKTSFANKVVFQLMSRGLRPIRISADNFYIPRGELPNGTDIESIEAIDLKYFNDFINRLLQGEELEMPMYDFRDGKRKFTGKVKIDSHQPIIIEGIHALNPRMTSDIPEYQKYKIYIAPQPQINIDNHTPVSMTDMRLLKRIARDNRTRNSDAKETISMWPNVRAGEFNYIYPTQEYADYVFDSFMPYEPCALRNIVLPQLDKIKPDCQEYMVAQRLKAMIKYFIPIPLQDIPCNSLIREFVGGTSFKDAR